MYMQNISERIREAGISTKWTAQFVGEIRREQNEKLYAGLCKKQYGGSKDIL